MSAITKAAAAILATALLTGAGAGAAMAYDGTVDTGYVTVAETAAPVTLEQVEAALAAFKTAQATALAVEKKALADYRAAEKAALVATKSAKGPAKKAAVAKVKALRVANRAALKALKATNQAAVDEAKAAYQALADLYEAQNAVVEVPVAPVVEAPVTDPAAVPAA